MNVLRFLHWMKNRGWPVFLYAPSGTVISEHAKEFDVPLVNVGEMPGLPVLWRAHTLAKRAKSDGVRIMIVHQSRDLLPCAIAKSYGGRFRLIYSQNMHLGNKRDPIHAWQYRKLDAFVAPVPALAKQAQCQTVVPPERIHIIPHGIERERFLKRVDKGEARSRLNLPQGVTIIGIIGRLDPKKGQDVGIKALAKVHASGRPAHLLIVGNPTLHEGKSYQEYLTGLVQKLGLGEFVHFRPWVAEPETAYAAMDIFVLTSQSETYGLVTLEAMTSGLPVIGTDSGGTVDIIEHEVNGLLFPPDNDAALAEALVQMLSDRSWAASLAARGRSDAIERYSHTQQCEAWERLIRNIVDKLQ